MTHHEYQRLRLILFLGRASMVKYLLAEHLTPSFSTAYLIGKISRAPVLAIKRWAFGLTIMAGKSMFLRLEGTPTDLKMKETLGPFAREFIVLKRRKPKMTINRSID